MQTLYNEAYSHGYADGEKAAKNRPRIDEPMLKGATDTAAMIVNELRTELEALRKERDEYRAVMEQAVEAMEYAQKVMLDNVGLGFIDINAITALREALKEE